MRRITISITNISNTHRRARCSNASTTTVRVFFIFFIFFYYYISRIGTYLCNVCAHRSFKRTTRAYHQPKRALGYRVFCWRRRWYMRHNNNIYDIILWTHEGCERVMWRERENQRDRDRFDLDQIILYTIAYVYTHVWSRQSIYVIHSRAFRFLLIFTFLVFKPIPRAVVLSYLLYVCSCVYIHKVCELCAEREIDGLRPPTTSDLPSHTSGVYDFAAGKRMCKGICCSVRIRE